VDRRERAATNTLFLLHRIFTLHLLQVSHRRPLQARQASIVTARSSYRPKAQLPCLRLRLGLPIHRHLVSEAVTSLLFPLVLQVQSVSNEIRGLCHHKALLLLRPVKIGTSSISLTRECLRVHLVEEVAEVLSLLEAAEVVHRHAVVSEIVEHWGDLMARPTLDRMLRRVPTLETSGHFRRRPPEVQP